MNKKILFIMSSLGGGGAEKALIILLRNFDYKRYDVHLLLSSTSGIYQSEVPEAVKVIPLYKRSGTMLERLAFFLSARFACFVLERTVTRKVVKERYDTIVSYMQGRPLKLHTYLLDRAARNISWVHADLYASHSSTRPGLFKTEEKHGYKSMDKVVFVSTAVKDQFMKLGYKIKKASVITNPIDFKRISSFTISREKKNPGGKIVLCGRLSPEKAFDRMTRVAKRLKEENISFRMDILGEGPERGYLQQLIELDNLQEAVCLRGFVSPPYPEMALADIFVSCSETEGYPLNVCEAMCLGLPIVATRCAGNTEVLADGKYGMLVEQNEEELYQAVKEMLLNKDLREEYAACSREGAKQFNLERVMSQVYDVL
ncbi:MAG: glycosyltransferase [Bacteroidales bacterium]|nr:glycosyltransferase [Bacteroidales bacterium]